MLRGQRGLPSGLAPKPRAEWRCHAWQGASWRVAPCQHKVLGRVRGRKRQAPGDGIHGGCVWHRLVPLPLGSGPLGALPAQAQERFLPKALNMRETMPLALRAGGGGGGAALSGEASS